MSILLPALLTAFIVSVISLAGVSFIKVSPPRMKKILFILVSFSAGAMLGGALLHLLPEAVALTRDSLAPYLLVIFGFTIFFVLEKALRVHHCHDGECETKQHIGTLNLVGDGVHNFIDGLIIVSSFAVNPGLGLVVSLSVTLHELPQELGDFGVLLYAGYTRAKALWFNFLSALLAVLGVLIGYIFINTINGLSAWLLPVAAGGFLYIAAADLIPEMHKDSHKGRTWWSLIIFIIALVFMWVLRVWGVE